MAGRLFGRRLSSGSSHPAVPKVAGHEVVDPEDVVAGVPGREGGGELLHPVAEDRGHRDVVDAHPLLAGEAVEHPLPRAQRRHIRVEGDVQRLRRRRGGVRQRGADGAGEDAGRAQGGGGLAYPAQELLAAQLRRAAGLVPRDRACSLPCAVSPPLRCATPSGPQALGMRRRWARAAPTEASCPDRLPRPARDDRPSPLCGTSRPPEATPRHRTARCACRS